MHEQYGIGRYVGIRMVDIAPANKDSNAKKTYVPTVIIQFKDTEISWYQKFVTKELWVYRSGDSGNQELSSIIDNRKWVKRKKVVQEKTDK